MQNTFKLSVFISIILFLLSCNNESKQEEPAFIVRGKSYMLKSSSNHMFSEEIDSAKAKAMRDHYKKGAGHFKTIYFDSQSRIVLDTLEGFRFSAADLEKIIANTNGKKAKDIIFYFGRDAADIPYGSRTYPSYAIIAMGVDSANNIGKSAYDKADPCPPYCPEGN